MANKAKIVFDGENFTATNERGLTLRFIGGVYNDTVVLPDGSSRHINLGDTLRLSKSDRWKKFRRWATDVFAALEECTIPDIHQTVYRAATQTKGALNMDAWHTCDTTHCRAGWVTTLAGTAGGWLERQLCYSAAANLIYLHNGYQINEERYYQGRRYALANMRKLAQLEAEGKAPSKDNYRPRKDRVCY